MMIGCLGAKPPPAAEDHPAPAGGQPKKKKQRRTAAKDGPPLSSSSSSSSSASSASSVKDEREARGTATGADVAKASSLTKELTELKGLHDAGVLSDDEFKQQKQQVLALMSKLRQGATASATLPSVPNEADEVIDLS